MKRLISFISALFVCCSSCFAWTSDSFIGNDYSVSEIDDLDYYSSDLIPFSSPRLFSSRDISSNNLYSLDFGSISSSRFLLDGPLVGLIGSYSFYLPTTGTSYDGMGQYGEALLPSSLSSTSDSSFYYFYGSNTLTYRFSGDSYTTFAGWDYLKTNAFEVVYDIPVPSNCYGISFSPYVNAVCQMYANGVYCPSRPVIWQFLINGEPVLEFDTLSSFYSQESTFTYTEPVTSCSLRLVVVSFNETSGLPSDSSLNGSFLVRLPLLISVNSSLTVGFLDEFGSLGVHNDRAQNDINNHNALESEWTGSMTANFDALNLSDFEYPSGLVSAFALISGIFNDLWNGMGEYRIVYVLPLTLGVVLVIVGKLSRTERKSSSASGGGEKSVGLVVRDR